MLSTKNIGLPDEPFSVFAKWIIWLSLISLIIPLAFFNFWPNGYWGIYIWLFINLFFSIFSE